MNSTKPGGANRRDFLKLMGLVSASALVPIIGCGKEQSPGTGSIGDTVPVDKMTYRTNPKTGDRISLLGYGCMRLPRIPRAQSMEGENDLDQEAINASIDYALAHGINYFDTSPAYCKGGSERATGIALKRHPRKNFLVATKLSNFRDGSREASMAMYHDSFKALQVDYLNYYLLHALGLGGIEAFTKRYIDNGMLDFLLEERKAGRIRNLGWSFHGSIESFDHLMSLKVDWDFVMIQVNYIDWKNPQGYNTVPAKYVYDELEKRRIPALIMEPLLGGRLARPHFKAQKILKQADPKASAASWAFRFAGSQSNVLTVLSGMTFKEHLQDNLRVFSPLVPLNQGDYELLERAAEIMSQYKSVSCTSCQYCMPCPYGIDIPGVFTHYNHCLNEGNFPDNEQDPDYRRARRAFLISLDRNVEKMRQSNRCTGCGDCLKECPQNIKIPQELERIDKFVEGLRVSAKGGF